MSFIPVLATASLAYLLQESFLLLLSLLSTDSLVAVPQQHLQSSSCSPTSHGCNTIRGSAVIGTGWGWEVSDSSVQAGLRMSDISYMTLPPHYCQWPVLCAENFGASSLSFLLPCVLAHLWRFCWPPRRPSASSSLGFPGSPLQWVIAISTLPQPPWPCHFLLCFLFLILYTLYSLPRHPLLPPHNHFVCLYVCGPYLPCTPHPYPPISRTFQLLFTGLNAFKLVFPLSS